MRQYQLLSNNAKKDPLSYSELILSWSELKKEVFCFLKKCLLLHPIVLWGLAVGICEDPVEVADVLITHRNGDIRNIPVCVTKQECCLGKPFFLNQLGIGFSRFPLDLPGKPGSIVMQLLRQFRKAAVCIIGFHIPQYLPNHRISLVIGTQGFRMPQKLHKEQCHRHLAHFPLAESILNQDPQQVLQKILNGLYFRYIEIQISGSGILAAKAINEEFPQGCFFLADHGERRGEKFRQHDEVDRNIPFPCPAYFMGGALIQKQQVTLLQPDFLSVNDVGGFAAAHINHFHIVVSMLREVDEACMGTDGDELTGSKQLAAIDGSFLALHVNIPVDIASAVQNFLLLSSNHRQLFQQFRIQSITPNNLSCSYDTTRAATQQVK